MHGSAEKLQAVMHGSAEFVARMAWLCIVSNFSATLVRPTLRRRLEASPLRVLLIDFIGDEFRRKTAIDRFPKQPDSGEKTQASI